VLGLHQAGVARDQGAGGEEKLVPVEDPPPAVVSVSRGPRTPLTVSVLQRLSNGPAPRILCWVFTKREWHATKALAAKNACKYTALIFL
jgi:hypothetical protein